MSYRIPVVKISMVRDGSITIEERLVRESTKAQRVIRDLIGGNDREEFVALFLDAKNRVMSVHTVAVGSLSLCIVHPREVFKAAILANASGIIVAHNHPSGDPTPSREDRELTDRLCEAGRILGITVLDHIIVGAENSDGRPSYTSFADSGWLK